MLYPLERQRFGDVVHTGARGTGVCHEREAVPEVGDDVDDGASVLPHVLIISLLAAVEGACVQRKL